MKLISQIKPLLTRKLVIKLVIIRVIIACLFGWWFFQYKYAPEPEAQLIPVIEVSNPQ